MSLGAIWQTLEDKEELWHMPTSHFICFEHQRRDGFYLLPCYPHRFTTSLSSLLQRRDYGSGFGYQRVLQFSSQSQKQKYPIEKQELTST
jgi:hypothetical protein